MMVSAMGLVRLRECVIDVAGLTEESGRQTFPHSVTKVLVGVIGRVENGILFGYNILRRSS